MEALETGQAAFHRKFRLWAAAASLSKADDQPLVSASSSAPIGERLWEQTPKFYKFSNKPAGGGGEEVRRYSVGNPQDVTSQRSFGFPVVQPTGMPAGRFLIGEFRGSATLCDRKTARVEVSTEDSTNLRMNLVTLLAEERVGLASRRARSLRRSPTSPPNDLRGWLRLATLLAVAVTEGNQLNTEPPWHDKKKG